MFRKQVMRGIAFYWGPFLIYGAIIFFLSHQSDPTSGVAFPFNDKLVHIGEFFILQLLAVRAFCFAQKKEHVKKCLVMSLFFCVLYALGDELHQRFIPERDSSLYDLLADLSGILLSVVAHMRFNFLR